jgi:hypothetical protein
LAYFLMTRLIIIMVSGMLLLGSGARAEITYMNCKFNEGWHQKGAKYEEVKKKSDLSSKDTKNCLLLFK